MRTEWKGLVGPLKMSGISVSPRRRQGHPNKGLGWTNVPACCICGDTVDIRMTSANFVCRKARRNKVRKLNIGIWGSWQCLHRENLKSYTFSAKHRLVVTSCMSLPTLSFPISKMIPLLRIKCTYVSSYASAEFWWWWKTGISPEGLSLRVVRHLLSRKGAKL